ncbi:MAG: putative (di)nucleoside polyphosphate hydrolase [Gammaproteobacteria bacterium]
MVSTQFNLINNPDYRANVGIMLVDKNHRILAGEALHYSGEWMMPQGGMDEGETTLQAMRRELFEETSIQMEETQLIKEHHKWLSYQFRKPLKKEGTVYIGQRQKWFLLEYNGVLPDASKTQDREFTQFDWVTPAWLIDNTTRFKAEVYKIIFSEFEDFFPE